VNIGTGEQSGSSGSDLAAIHRIELEIEATRAELNRTLEALQARLSPRRRLQAALRNARVRSSQIADRSGDFVRDATGVVRREPLPFVIAAVGVVAIFAARTAMKRGYLRR
jgi:hypothetical protein